MPITLPHIHRLTMERRNEVLHELDQSASPGFSYFFMITLSCGIATFGLLTDSAAVIIGAMLVAPLMSPILGLSLASVAGRQRMFRRSFISLIVGVMLSVALAILLSLIAKLLPFSLLVQLPGEVLSRTKPSPFDLGIGIAGGAAAAYALAQPKLSAALPGVAIATALMPPVCTIGIGIAIQNSNVAFGATLLFFTNLVAISFAGILVFAVLGFRPAHLENTWHHIPRGLFLTAGLVLITAIPLSALTYNLVTQARLSQDVQNAVAAELANLPNTQLVDFSFNTSGETLELQVTIRTSNQPNYVQVVNLQKAIAARLQRTIALDLIVIPTTELNPLVPPTYTPTATPGPSLTPTLTPSVTPTYLPTNTSSPTPSNTPTSTPTYTPTPTLTPTPVLAYIANTGGLGIYLRETPDGKIIGVLPQGSEVQILYEREIVNGITWIHIRDLFNRLGWIPINFLAIQP
jgi:uncharacterized hydrophobic protein (TIGR00271 family)